jgi:ABC-type microcin C transport system duplicated ATPase subunit YejF
MVFQDPYGSLHPRHTIGDILEEPLQIHRIHDRDRRIMRCWTKWASIVRFANAIRISFPVASGSAWRLPER